MQDTQITEPTASTAGVYEKWLEVRCLFVGLRIAWVSVASVLVGFALFLTAPPAQDILLETKGDLAADAAYWANFYLLVILTWALPVFVSARWILTFTEDRPNAPALFESLPRWVRQYIPALLVLLCFFAILVGQFIALRDAPEIVDEGREVFIADARSQDTEDGLAACRASPLAEECLRFATKSAVVAAANLLGAHGNEAYYIYGFAAIFLLWFALPVLTRRFVPAPYAVRATSTVNLLLFFAAIAALASAAASQAWAMPAAGVLGLMALFLWWYNRHRILWWLATVCALPLIAVAALAVYGIFEIERQSEFNLIHLLLLPPATVLAAAISWWCLRPRREGKATIIGQILLRMTGSARDSLTETAATQRLVNPIFAVLLIGSATTIVALILIHPLRITEWGHRALLLPIILGLPVAAITYLTCWSARVKAPLVLAAIVLIGGFGMLATLIAGDHYRIRSVSLTDAPPRPDLSMAVEQWAKANECDLPNERAVYRRSCPPPIIVAAAGGASRAAFHTAGVLGKLLDDGRLARLKGHSAAVHSAAFSPDGKMIVTAALDRTPRLWNAETGQATDTLVGHKLGVNSAAFSPDGKRIVTASGDSTARVWNVSSFGRSVQLKELAGHSAGVNSAAFSPDSKLVVTASDDKTARVWDAGSGAEMLLLNHDKQVYSAAFSPDGRQIVTAARDGIARIWDLPAPDALQNLRRSTEIRMSRVLVGHTKRLNSASWSPDGKLVATASDDKTARVWNAADGRPLAVLQGHDDRILSVAFSPIIGDRRLITAGWDGTARTWALPDLDAVREPGEINAGTVQMAHRHGVNAAQFSPDAKIVVTASRDKTVRIWDAATGSRLQWPGEVFPYQFRNQLFAISAVSGGSLGAVVSYAALADSQRADRAKNGLGKPPCVVEGMRDADWFAAKKQQASALEISEDPRHSWKACLQLLVAGDFLSPVFVGMVSNDPFSINLHGDRAELIERAWETRYARLTEQNLALGLIFKEKVTDFRYASTLAQPMSMVRGTTPGWLPLLLLNGTSVEDGRRIVTGDVDTVIRDSRGEENARILLDAHDFHDLFSAKAMARGHSNSIFTIDPSRDARLVTAPPADPYLEGRIVTASIDRTARIWDMKTGAELAVLKGHAGRVFSAAFNPDSTHVVTAGDDKTARIWDVSNLSAIKHASLVGHTDEVNSAAFSPDGRRVASVSDDRTVRIWDAAGFTQLAKLEGHTNNVLGVAFSPDGQLLATGSQDRTARVWDVSNAGQSAASIVLRGHGGTVNSVAFNRAGTQVVTSSADKTARIWDAKSGAMLATLADGHTSALYHAAFSPDGKRVVTASADDTMGVWNVTDLSAVKFMRKHAHGGNVYSAVFSPDGSLILTGSGDRTAKAWDAESGKMRQSFTPHRIKPPCRECDVRLSTAISMSARFPIISPPGSILDTENRAITRVVDGGYHENFGALTAMELKRALKTQFGLSAAVILINNEPKVSRMDCVTQGTGLTYLRQPATSWFPTITTPLDTIVGTRTARGSHAAVNLCMELVAETTTGRIRGLQRFAFVTVGHGRETAKDLSVSWWMSKRVQKHLDDQLAENRLNVTAFDKIAGMRRGN